MFSQQVRLPVSLFVILVILVPLSWQLLKVSAKSPSLLIACLKNLACFCLMLLYRDLCNCSLALMNISSFMTFSMCMFCVLRNNISAALMILTADLFIIYSLTSYFKMKMMKQSRNPFLVLKEKNCWSGSFPGP